MKLWKRETSLEQLNRAGDGCMVSHVGIEFTLLGDDFLEATMPVDGRTRQPFGLLHGGASVVLAESMGSMAGYLCSEGEQKVVGLEINANHLRAVFDGQCAGCVAHCTSAVAIRCGKSRSSTRAIGCAAPRV